MNSLEVGAQGTATASGADAIGTLNLTNVTAGTIGIASGGSLKVGSTLSGTGTSVNGTITLGNNWTSTTVGVDASNRAIVEIGRKNNNDVSTGSFTQTGGTFNAFLFTLDVGQSTIANGSAVTGTLTPTGTSPTIDTTVLNIGNATGGVGAVKVAQKQPRHREVRVVVHRAGECQLGFLRVPTPRRQRALHVPVDGRAALSFDTRQQCRSTAAHRSTETRLASDSMSSSSWFNPFPQPPTSA